MADGDQTNWPPRNGLVRVVPDPEVEAIVRALAECDTTFINDDDYGYQVCATCNADETTEQVAHLPDCAWLRARTWVASHPS